MSDARSLIESLQLGYRPRVLIAISARENIPTPFAMQLMKLRAIYGDVLEDILFDFVQPVDLSRNNLFTKFLTDYPYATHIFLLDTDVMVPDDIIIRLLLGEKGGRLLTSGLVVKKNPPHYPLANSKYGPNTYKPIIGWPQNSNLIDASSVAFGCLLINRKVLQDIPYPFCMTGNVGQSEDYSFCEKAIAYGFYPCLNVQAQCAHIGMYYYTFNDTLRFIGHEQAVASSVINKDVLGAKNQNAQESNTERAK